MADAGRHVRLRYCSSKDDLVREELVPYELDIAEAVAVIQRNHAEQHTGEGLVLQNPMNLCQNWSIMRHEIVDILCLHTYLQLIPAVVLKSIEACLVLAAATEQVSCSVAAAWR